MVGSVNRTMGRVVVPGILLVLFTALISGVSNFVNAWAVQAWAVQGTNTDAFITVRNVVVALLLVPLALLLGRGARKPLRRKDWVRLAGIGILGGAIPFLLFFRGIQMATRAGGAASATFGYRTLFLMAAVLAVVVLRERLSPRLLLAAALLLLGNALLVTLTGPIWTEGTGLVLLATALWASEYTLSKHTLRDLPSGTVALGRMGFGGMFLLAYLGASGQLGAVTGFSGVQWQWMALSAILLVGFVSTWYAGLKHVDLSVATATLLLAFPITWALDVLFRGQAFAPAQAAGIVAIVAGVILAIGVASLRETWIALAEAVRSRARSGQ